MAMFFHEDIHKNSTKFDRYREILERDYKNFFLAGFMTLLGFLPFVVGLFFAFASKSLIVMLLSSIIGGLIAGPALYALYDVIFRSFRNQIKSWSTDYFKAIKTNWKDALISGIACCLFIGTFVFIFMLFMWTGIKPSAGTIFILIISAIIISMLFSVYLPQLVLFKQSNSIRLKNCVLFCIKYFWSTLRTAILKLLYLLIVFLFLPWSIFLLLILGIWFILFVSNFLLYDNVKEAFQLKD